MARKAGKIRFAGISIHPGDPVICSKPKIIGKNHFDVLLVVYNFANAARISTSRSAETAKAGIGVVAMKVMAGGSKSGRRGENVKTILGNAKGRWLAALKKVLAQESEHKPPVPSRA